MTFHPEVDKVTSRQYGLASFGQLRALGLSRRSIQSLESSEILIRARRGVYRSFGAKESWHMMAMGAVLAAGGGAALSHRSAAILWGLRDPRAEPADSTDSVRSAESGGAPLELTCVRQLRLDGVKAYRHALPAEETTTRKRIPVTTVERTLLVGWSESPWSQA